MFSIWLKMNATFKEGHSLSMQTNKGTIFSIGTHGSKPDEGHNINN